MSGKYYFKKGSTSTDVSTVAASKVHLADSGFGSVFTGEGPFQCGGTDTNNITITGYFVGDEEIKVVKKGYYPVISNVEHYFYSLTSAGTYSLVRTDSTLKIGSATFYPSDFRDNVIPSELIIVVVGPGGGGGGNGYYKYEKNKYRVVPGGAGGGGGLAVGRIDIKECSTLSLEVGQGGAAGSDGSSSAQSSGGTGSGNPDGENYNASPYVSRVIIKVRNETAVDLCPLAAAGGAGGTGGTGGDGSYTCGAGGAGGWASAIESYGVKKATTGYGGDGCCNANITNSECSYTKFLATTETGASNTTIFYGYMNGSDVNKTAIADSQSYYSGGCSHGYGTYFFGLGDIYHAEAGSGGGGGAGVIKGPGGSGCIMFYY